MPSMDQSLDFRRADLRLFVRDVRDRQARKRPITVRSWSSIKDVKDAIQQTIHVPASAQRLFFGPLLTSGGELPNYRSLHDAGIYRSGETLLLDIKAGSHINSESFSAFPHGSPTGNDIWISSSTIDSTPRPLRQILQQARRGFALGLKPEFILDGSGGSYFIHDARKVKLAVFKPADEEPYAVNNPRGYLPQPGQLLGMREGIAPGEACIREVAAYLLDHGGFSGVPMTTLAEARHPAFNTNGLRLNVSQGGASIGSHSIVAGSSADASAKKVGSFQEFVRSECTMDDLSPSKVSVDEVHKIAILDIRLMNADRNSANLLCRRRRDDSIELVPIDHGYCLRSVCDVSWMDWCWLDWPQLKQPLSEKTRKYILGLDIEADARMLHERLNISEATLDYFRASSKILKAGVQAGLSLYDIAIICCRNDNMGEVPSKLEVLTSMASELAYSAIENERWHHTAASRALADQLSPQGGSLIQSTNHQDTRRMRKSASTAHFTSLVGSEIMALEQASKYDTPAMVQSSVSDTSSDCGDFFAENEDCDEWAAAVIADVSLDKSMSMIMQSKARSHSIESDTSSDSGSSGSPRGFWLTRPGSSPEDVDDDSFTWSPTASPGNGATTTVFTPESFDALPPPPLLGGTPKTGYSTKSLKLAFDDTGNIEKVTASLKAASLADGGGSVKFADNDNPKELIRHESSLSRSQSYSALSGVKCPQSDLRIPKYVSDDYNHFRDYFRKFVDLVIVREMSAASRAG